MGGTWAEVRADLCAALNCVPATFFADRHRSRSLPPTSNTHEEMTWHDFNPTSTLVPHLPWPRSSEEPGHGAVKTFVGKGHPAVSDSC